MHHYFIFFILLLGLRSIAPGCLVFHLPYASIKLIAGLHDKLNGALHPPQRIE